MNPFSQVAIVLLLILSAFINQLTAQTSTHSVTLQVNTSTLQSENVDASCDFGQAAGILNKDHTIEASVGDFIIWDAVSTNAPETDQVLITSIVHESGRNLLGQNTIKDNNQLPGVVMARVMSGEAGEIQKYSITFKVMSNGSRRRGTFVIDPKIQVRN